MMVVVVHVIVFVLMLLLIVIIVIVVLSFVIYILSDGSPADQFYSHTVTEPGLAALVV